MAATCVRPSPTSLLLLSVSLVALRGAAQSTGDPQCPCIPNILTHPSLSAITHYREGENLVFTASGSTTKYYYPLSYGSGECKAYDKGLPPSCDQDPSPGWCSAAWCYVDPNNCAAGISRASTQLFHRVENLYFSYATCSGGQSTNTVDAWSSQDTQAAQNVIRLIEDYGRASRFVLEDIARNHNQSVDCSIPGREMCPCRGCKFSPSWQNEMDFMTTGFIPGDSAFSLEEKRAECLSSGLSNTYMTAAAKEADPSRQRVGYLYFGDQATGGYTSWPREEFCSAETSGYDPRARPWYSAGATGPKDVIIIADVSGSMREADRHKLAKAAVKKILDTMTWKDFATIILFNSAVTQVYSSELVPLTDTNRNAMKSWCESQDWEGGGTNFAKPLERAFEILKQSIAKGSTSMCQKVVMFLTDGEDSSYGSDRDYAWLAEQSTLYDAFVFTYALGNGADKSKVKRMACENRGVFYAVSDNADLGAVMSQYYEYFAHGQELCSASFVSYTSATGGQTLVTGCMAAYDRTGPAPDLLGVSCMDASMITDVAAWQRQPGWAFFACTASDMTKQCRQVELTECHRQKIRKAYSSDSVCSESRDQQEFSGVSKDTVCPCTDQRCQDDPTWTDELGYFCDTWVGDDCSNPNPTWGYSEQGLVEVREKCQKSCGNCEWSEGACTRSSSLECPEIPVASECRACLGKTSGVDIEQKPMACPPGAPRNIAPTTPPPAADGVASIGAMASPIVVALAIIGGAAPGRR